MKRYLRRLFLGGAAAIMLLMMMGCSLVFMNILENNARTSLKTVIKAFELLETPAEEECQEIAAQMADMEDGLEVAFIREDGTLIASAPGDAELGRNCRNDQDVLRALIGAWGDVTRQQGKRHLYVLYNQTNQRRTDAQTGLSACGDQYFCAGHAGSCRDGLRGDHGAAEILHRPAHRPAAQTLAAD